MALEIDDVVNAVASVVVVFSTENECLINDIAKLVNDVLGGELSAVGYHANARVTDILGDVEELLSHFVESDVVDAVFTELNKLYADATMNSFVDSTLAIAMDDAINAVESVLVVAMAEQATKVSHVADLAEYLLDGEVSAIVIDGSATVGSTITLVKAIALDYVESEELAVVLDELSTLLAEVTIANIGEEILALDIDDVITTVNNITDVFFVNDVVNTIYEIAHAGLYGTLGAIGFDAMAAWEVTPAVAQNVIIATLAVAGTVMYFVANDTLVELVTMALGEEAVLGEFLAEPMGYTAETYLFEGEENALASAIFNTKVVEIIDDDFDFGAAYYDLLSVENVLGIADALVTTYVANEIADVAIEGLIALYGDTHIVDEIVDATLALNVDDVTEYVADVVIAITGEECLVSDIAKLVTDVLDGKLSNIG
jgi:hypothetical protein